MHLPPNFVYFEAGELVPDPPKKYDFGFAYTPPDQPPSQILCNLFPEFDHIEFSISLKTNPTKIEKILLDLVFQKARELGFSYIFTLAFLGESDLRWYQRQGFKILSKQYHPQDLNIQVYAMSKPLSHP